MVSKSKDYAFKMSTFKKLSIVHGYIVYVHIKVKSPCCSGGINARGVRSVDL